MMSEERQVILSDGQNTEVLVFDLKANQQIAEFFVGHTVTTAQNQVEHGQVSQGALNKADFSRVLVYAHRCTN